MNQPIVFVGGIHGVGKTTVSRLLAELLPAKHVTAGALIRATAGAQENVTVGIAPGRCSGVAHAPLVAAVIRVEITSSM